MDIKSTIIILATMSSVYSQEVDQPAGLLGPRNYNHHAYEVYQNTLAPVKPTKQGPVLFPNDAPPPPRPPLIVTSRPLLEQVSRSELNQNSVEANNSIAEQSQINRVKASPGFLARIKQYTPFNYVTPSPVVLVDSVTGRPLYSGTFQTFPEDSREYKHPYADVVRKSQILNADRDRGHRYNDYEERSVLPPIYKALSDHANEKVLRLQQKKLQNDPYKHYQVKEPNYINNDFNTNELDNNDNTHGEYNKGKKYAFSYSVRDHKTGDDFSHHQHSSGQATNGEYRVRLPDGRMQIVSYIADENGYKADVRYDEDKTVGNSIDYNVFNNNNNNHKENNNIAQNYNAKGNDYNINKQTYDNSNNNNPIGKNEDYYQYTDYSKEYNSNDYLDYADRNNLNYNPNPNVRKFANFDPKAKNIGVIVVPNQVKSTVRPSYEELKPLFVTRKPQILSTETNYLYEKVPFELSVPSTTSNPLYNDFTTERVVLIGGPRTTLYTNIKNSYPSVPVTTPSPILNSVTPSYLIQSTQNPFSTKNVQITNDKAILSSSFLDRINKYLSYN